MNPHVKAVHATQTNHRPDPLQIVSDRCFHRGVGVATCDGSSIEVRVTNSGIVFAHPTFNLGHSDNHSLHIAQSTFVNSYLIGMYCNDTWPTEPLSFRMERSLFAHLQCCPVLVVIQPPDVRGLDPVMMPVECVRRAFRQFQATDNIASYHDGWWASLETIPVSHALSQEPNVSKFAEIDDVLLIRQHIVSALPTIDETVRFGPRIEQIRSQIWTGEIGSNYDQRIVLPEDLVPSSRGPLAQHMAVGLLYGCDVSQLPVPPAATLEPYEYPDASTPP
jgi:hypothetical protein